MGALVNLTHHFLIAMPAMADPRFQQSVIYMCAHPPEGAMGLVLNRPIVKPTFDDLLKQLNVEPLPPVRQIKLCAGGPVENARGFVLHTSDWTGEGSLKVDSAMALTASLDVLKVIAEGRGPRECFAVGILVTAVDLRDPTEIGRTEALINFQIESLDQPVVAP